MTIVTKTFQHAKGAFAFLEDLALQERGLIVFRGHVDQRWRLVNTWQRHLTIQHRTWDTTIDDTFTRYNAGLKKLGQESFDIKSRFDAMEYSRHHGLPTPCLDFSYSPYVALFFAFNGVRASQEKTSYSVIYALNVDQLALSYAKERKPLNCSSTAQEQTDFYEVYHRFSRPTDDFLADNFPADVLQLFPFPSSRNTRMQRQMGCLLYDTLHHRRGTDLENYLEKLQEVETAGEATKPVLTKILINQKAIRSVLEKLEIMNITAGMLYGNPEGVAMDIMNSYNYNPKFFDLHDIRPPTFRDPFAVEEAK